MTKLCIDSLEQAHLQESPVEVLNSREERIAVFEANMHWFEAAKERLAKEFPDSMYVAVCQGTAVLAGNDSLEVALEFHRKFGRQPVYIGKLFGPEDETYIAHEIS